MKPEWFPWAGIFTGPIVWFLSMETNFALAPRMCGRGGKTAAYVVCAVALLITATTARLSWMRWRQVTGEATADVSLSPSAGPMSLAGAVVSGSSFIVILAQAIPNLMMGGCE